MARMRIAFLGTPDFAVPALAALAAAGHEIAAVYAQPPAPRGRGQAVKPTPVQAFAESLGLPVRTPASMRDADAIAAFQALDLDAAAVVAYGQILPAAVLDAPRLGSFNLHGSLLPRWRGAAPIQRAVMAGDRVTGVQVMRMTPGLDEGPVLLSETVRIGPKRSIARSAACRPSPGPGSRRPPTGAPSGSRLCCRGWRRGKASPATCWTRPCWSPAGRAPCACSRCSAKAVRPRRRTPSCAVFPSCGASGWPDAPLPAPSGI